MRYIPGKTTGTGYVQSWHFDVQQDLGHNLLLDVAYVGNHGVGLTILADANQALPYTLGKESLGQCAPSDSELHDYRRSHMTADSAPTTLCKPNSRSATPLGLYFINSFTWSKAIDNAAGPS